MAETQMKDKKKLPNGIGMQIIIGGDSDLYPDKQRFVLEFLLNRELTEDEEHALYSSIKLEDDVKKLKRTKNYHVQEIVFKKVEKQEYIPYRAYIVRDKDEQKEDIDRDLRVAIEKSVGNNLSVLWCDVYKVRRFYYEMGKKTKIYIPEEKLLKILNEQEVLHSSQ